ncbi:MAG: hypothetical protein ABIT20_08120 [Gemmatimonadaceae bacterium]
MLHASALAVGWKSAFLALFSPRRNDDGQTAVSSIELSRPFTDCDDEREPFHLDDTEIALRLVTSRGLQEYKTPPHVHLMFPQLPAR